MGSINSIYPPKNWTVLKQGVNKNNNNDVLYFMQIGEFDDSISQGQINIFISKSNYEKILNHEYKVAVFKYNENPIKLYNNLGNEIPLINNQQCKNIEYEKN